MVVWLAPEQAAFVGQVAQRAGVRIHAAGSPVPGRSAEVALALAAEPIHDLRTFLNTLSRVGGSAGGAAAAGGGGVGGGGVGGGADASRIQTVWIASIANNEVIGDHAVLKELRACLRAGVQVVTSQALPSSVLEYAAPSDQPGVAGVETASVGGDPGALSRARMDWPQFFPLFRAGKFWLDAQDFLADFGPVRTAHFESLGLHPESSLGSRLLDAMDAVRGLLGEPEDVFAAHVVPPGISASPAANSGPGSLRALAHGPGAPGLRGTMSVSMRFSDGRAASALVSDVGGRWSRSITLLGDPTVAKGGRLRVGDSSMEWTGAEGEILESSRARRRSLKLSPAVDVFAELLGEPGRRRLATLSPMNHLGTLAMTGAALLSARTGEPEAPQMIRRMVTAG